jgi:hypothetical protein
VPFKSESQRKWMYANHPEMAKRWQKHTPKGQKLPEHVEKKTMEKQAINEILLSLLAGGGLGGAGGATLAHKYHKHKIPQYKEQGAIQGYEEGFADAGKKLQDQLQESLAPVLLNIARRREAEEFPKAATALIALELMKNAGHMNLLKQQPPGMRDDAPARTKPMARLLNRVTAPRVQQQAATPAAKTDDLGAALAQDAESEQAIAEAHPSLGARISGTRLAVPEFRRGESAEISRRARQSWPTEEVPPAPFEQFIREFKQKQMAPLW